MSGSNYNILLCQVLENERTLKLSNILKLFNRQAVIRKDRASFMEFLNTFTSDNISDCGDAVDLQIYSSIFTNECRIQRWKLNKHYHLSLVMQPSL